MSLSVGVKMRHLQYLFGLCVLLLSALFQANAQLKIALYTSPELPHPDAGHGIPDDIGALSIIVDGETLATLIVDSHVYKTVAPKELTSVDQLTTSMQQERLELLFEWAIAAIKMQFDSSESSGLLDEANEQAAQQSSQAVQISKELKLDMRFAQVHRRNHRLSRRSTTRIQGQEFFEIHTKPVSGKAIVASMSGDPNPTHSGTVHIQANGVITVYCNHGTCPGEKAMTYACGYVNKAEYDSEQMSAQPKVYMVCDDIGSKFGEHVCNTDTEVEKRQFLELNPDMDQICQKIISHAECSVEEPLHSGFSRYAPDSSVWQKKGPSTYYTVQTKGIKERLAHTGDVFSGLARLIKGKKKLPSEQRKLALGGEQYESDFYKAQAKLPMLKTAAGSTQ